MNNKGTLMASGNWIIIAVIAVVILGMFMQKQYDVFSISGTETVSRGLPSEGRVNQNFQLTYTIAGASGKWFVSITNSVTGGCKFPNGGTTYQDAWLSSSGTSKSIIITSPTTPATCTFTGDYQFGNFTIKNMLGPTAIQIKACKTDADTDCNGIVSDSEILAQISNWLSGSITRTKLGEYAMAWVES